VNEGFRAACVQITAGRELAPNIDRARNLVREAFDAGADFVSLPENVTMIEPDTARAREKAVPEDDHPGLPAFRELAAESGRWLHVGSLSIAREDGRIANRSFLIDGAGGIVARYDKLHLFDVRLGNGESYRESDNVAPGERAVLAPTPWGPIGLTICYDLRFPALYRSLARAGARFLTIPAAFTRTTGRAHWEVLVRARAIETGCFVIAAAQCGEHAEGRSTWGHSLIVDPWGTVMADGGEAEGVILADIDPAEVDRTRRRIPALEHDRDFAPPGPATFSVVPQSPGG